MSKIASKERNFKVSIFVAVTSKNVKKGSKIAQKVYVKEASRFESMVKASSGRRV